MFFGLIYYKVDMTQEGIQDINGLHFVTLIYVTLIYTFQTIKNFPVEKDIFEREHQNGCYRVVSYYLAKSLVEVDSNFLPFFILFSHSLFFLYSLIFYI